MDPSRVIALSEKYYDQVVELRHFFHRHPELAFNEFMTADRIAGVLTDLGIEVQSGIAETGVVGLIRGGRPGRTVLLRADMDALPIQEAAPVDYRSEIPGRMHACGHDGHTAGLLGVAMILQELRDEISGNIKLLFQPAEEDTGGALPMIEAGVMADPPVDAAFGCHLWGSLPAGYVEFKKGALMASPDSFEITLTGRGGHAAMPHRAIDPVIMAAQVIEQTQTVISRRLDPLLPAVISITMIHGGKAHNVIPDEVTLAGTIRTFDPAVRDWIPQVFEEIIRGVTQSHGGSYTFRVDRRYPPLINDEDMTDLAAAAAGRILGALQVRWAERPTMGGEDFAYFAEAVPGCFWFVGIAPGDDVTVNHHQPLFQWSDQNLLPLMQTLAQTALDFLSADSD